MNISNPTSASRSLPFNSGRLPGTTPRSAFGLPLWSCASTNFCTDIDSASTVDNTVSILASPSSSAASLLRFLYTILRFGTLALCFSSKSAIASFAPAMSASTTHDIVPSAHSTLYSLPASPSLHSMTSLISYAIASSSSSPSSSSLASSDHSHPCDSKSFFCIASASVMMPFVDTCHFRACLCSGASRRSALTAAFAMSSKYSSLLTRPCTNSMM